MYFEAHIDAWPINETCNSSVYTSGLNISVMTKIEDTAQITPKGVVDFLHRQCCIIVLWLKISPLK